MGALTLVGTLWAEIGALSTLWSEMGALLNWEVPRSTWDQMGQEWAHSAFVGTL